MFQKSTDVTGLSGGSLRVTIPATPFQVRATNTETPIKRCWLLCPSGSSDIRVNIGSACMATTGIAVPEAVTVGIVPICLEGVGDLSLLYFIGAVENDVVDILYLV